MAAYAETAQAVTRYPRERTWTLTRREGDSSARDAVLQKNEFQTRFLSLRYRPRVRILKKRPGKPKTIYDKATAYACRALQRREENRATANACGGRRRARQKGQACVCCTPAEFKAVYAQAAATGREVDHVTPLCIGGLHCVKNLQLLTREVHALKTKADIAEFRAF